MCVCVVGGVLALCLIKAGMICSMESHQPSHGSLSASLVVQVVKNLSAMQETRVQSLGQEDPLAGTLGVPLGGTRCVGGLLGVAGRLSAEEGNPAGLSSCSGGLRPLVELCVEPAGLCGRPTDRGAR